jgi:hypothetical protein
VNWAISAAVGLTVMVGLVRVASQRRLTEVKIPNRLGLHRKIFRKMILLKFHPQRGHLTASSDPGKPSSA